jgi:4-hydroxy-3-polyprenylbenzoate decarboxylase
MVFDEKTMVGPVLPFSDMGKMFYGKYVPKNKPMPFATVIGCDPLSGVAACAPSPIPEDQFTGMLMGKPVELVKCETCDLEVPAHAEMIIEGEVIPNIWIEEAPFGEYTTLYGMQRENPVITITAITMRKDAIFKTLLNFRREGDLMVQINMAARCLGHLKEIASARIGSEIFSRETRG